MSAFRVIVEQAMESLGLSQPQLATKMGTAQTTVNRIIRGVTKRPPVETIEAMEAALLLPRHSLWKLLHGDTGKASIAADDFGLRLFGSVPAGFPVEPQEGYGDEWNFREHLGGPGRYLLKVRGVSMSGDGIHDGDLVVVQADRTGNAGQIVVAKINGEDTVKRLVKRGKGWELVSSHQDFPPIPLTRNDHAGVVGVVVGLVRLY